MSEEKIDTKELKGEVFGSYYIIKYTGQLDTVAFNRELNDLFANFNNQFSTYHSNSLISQFNALPANKPIMVSAEFITMLKMAEKFHRETNGAFDPTLRPVIKLWGFGGGKTRKTPTEQELKLALKKVNFKAIKWDENEKLVWKTQDGIELDVNAFVPGWAGDQIGELLEKHHITNYMVDISGEILFRGKKSGTNSWVVGVEKPSKEYATGVQVALRMENLAISTSGNYRQFYDDQGKRISHIIDPRTGYPVQHTIASASVITLNAAEGDAWSTALMVLGPKEGMELSEKNGMKVLLIDAPAPGVTKEIISPSMKRFMEEYQL